MAASDALSTAVGVVMSGGSLIESELGNLAPDASVRMLQSTLNALTGSKLKLDGVIGRQTLSAFLRAQREGTRAVTAIAAALPVRMPASILTNEVDAVVNSVAKSVTVPRSFLELLLRLEPVRVDEFFLLDRTGKFVGLTQFDRRTYDDMRRETIADESLLGASNALPSFGDFIEATPIEMARVSLLAASAYYKVNYRRLRRALGRADFKYTDGLAYLAHNQGATGAAQYLTTGSLSAPKQSPTALKVMSAARAAFV